MWKKTFCKTSLHDSVTVPASSTLLPFACYTKCRQKARELIVLYSFWTPNFMKIGSVSSASPGPWQKNAYAIARSLCRSTMTFCRQTCTAYDTIVFHETPERIQVLSGQMCTYLRRAGRLKKVQKLPRMTTFWFPRCHKMHWPPVIFRCDRTTQPNGGPVVSSVLYAVSCSMPWHWLCPNHARKNTVSTKLAG